MKRLVIAIFIIFASFLTFSLYRTFAYDTSVVEETPSTTDLEYTFKIGNSSIKQITVDSGETKYYDVVLGNPNPAKISYGVYYEMVSPSTKPDGFSIEYTSKSTGESTGKVDKEGNITLNLVVTNTSSSTVTVKLGTVAGYVNGGELTLNSGQEYIPEKVLTASEYIMSLNDGTTGDSGSGVYKVRHDAIPADSSATGEIIEATDDYRYYGKNPNNYICLDKNSDNTCEDRHLYRIIGSMREDSDNIYKLKVVKATPLTDGTTSTFSWDCKKNDSQVKLMVATEDENFNCNWSHNIWNSSTEDSSLMQILNNTWLNGKAVKNYGNSYNGETVDFSNYSPSSQERKIINENSIYYLGGTDTYYIEDEQAYIYERGKNISNGSNNYWIGTIGLIYPSDYIYISGKECYFNKTADCNDKNWIWNTCENLNTSNKLIWTITPYTGTSGKAFCLYQNRSDGIMSYPIFVSGSIFPTFYLKPEVVITDGTGEETNHFTVSIE